MWVFFGVYSKIKYYKRKRYFSCILPAFRLNRSLFWWVQCFSVRLFSILLFSFFPHERYMRTRKNQQQNIDDRKWVYECVRVFCEWKLNVSENMNRNVCMSNVSERAELMSECERVYIECMLSSERERECMHRMNVLFKCWRECGMSGRVSAYRMNYFRFLLVVFWLFRTILYFWRLACQYVCAGMIHASFHLASERGEWPWIIPA